jgi:hypothetical protein
MKAIAFLHSLYATFAICKRNKRDENPRPVLLKRRGAQFPEYSSLESIVLLVVHREL